MSKRLIMAASVEHEKKCIVQNSMNMTLRIFFIGLLFQVSVNKLALLG